MCAMATAAGVDGPPLDGHDGRALARVLLDVGVGGRYSYRDLETASRKVAEANGGKPIATTQWFRLVHPEAEPKKHAYPVPKLRMITDTLVHLGVDITFAVIDQANGTNSGNSQSPGEKNLKYGAPTLDVMMSVVQGLPAEDLEDAILEMLETLSPESEARIMLKYYQRKAAKTGEPPSDTDGPGQHP